MTAVPEGTVSDVLDWVGDDPQRAQQALDAERAGANRSTLTSQLEATASREDSNMTDEPTATDDDDVEEVPAPEQPTEVAIYPGDTGTMIHATQLRDSDVETPDEPLFAEPDDDDDDPSPVEGEQVEYIDAVSTSNGLAVGINGTVFLFSAQSVGQLKQVVDRAVVGLAL